ncbi:Uncharacterised protein [Bordetella pertussis]|nr:Uncharacterised protein [Bordetella pertussis]
MSRVLYRPAPRSTRSAITASSSETASPTKATSAENTAVTRKESR